MKNILKKVCRIANSGMFKAALQMSLSRGYIFIFMAIFLYSCNYTKTENKSTVSMDTLFERKIPVLTFNNECLQKELDSIVAKEVNCYDYKKDTTCFLVQADEYGRDILVPIFLQKTHDIDFSDKEVLVSISSWNTHDIDFSEIGFDKEKRIDGVYGYFKYKGFSFFCYASCMKYTDLFYETTDSVQVKNSPLLLEYEPIIDDSRTNWGYIYKNKKLIEFAKTICYSDVPLVNSPL